QMLDHVIEKTPKVFLEGFSQEEIWQALMDREARQSTGIGAGVALPHARLTPFNHLVMCLAILKEDIAFDAIDEQPIRIACMVLTNEHESTLALKVLSKLSMIMMNPTHREHLLAAASNDAVYDFLASLDLDIDLAVLAEDLMKPSAFAAWPDMDIAEVTHRMMSHRESAIAVQTKDGELLGEITADDLFQYGMPDFFKQLQSVSFVKHFDPLEDYFHFESSLKAKDLMSSAYADVDRKATLIEVIFLLSVKKHARVYVTEKGELVGVIDRLSVLNRAINF
ncbi:MAG: PTS system nitrogen regulatory IIA component, partial [Verrucomicrobiales bacterium]